MILKTIGRATLVATVLTLAACSDNGVDNELAADSKILEAKDGQQEADAAALNIVDTAVAAGSFNTLVAALQATSLDSVLADEANTFTVFAPTDEAFEALGQDTINALLGDTDTLSNILLYHVFPDAAVNAETAISLAGSMITMANGDDVAVVLTDGKLFINQSEVIVTDVVASNGIIHVIDTVLTPPAKETVEEPVTMNIVETAVAAGSFNTLAAALTAAGLIDTLSDPDAQFTVFAPTFAALPEGTVEALLADPETLTDILLYHVIGGAVVDSTTAISLAGQNATMANGDDVAISLRDGALFVNDSTVISTDILASNGIIHVIDAVLLPPADMDAGSDENTEEMQDEAEPLEVTAPEGTILAIAQGNPDFSILATAVTAAGLDGALGHPGDIYTVFAPTNDAFAALGSDTINALLADPAALENVLRTHIIPGTVVDAATALSLVGFDIQAGNGEIIKLRLDGDDLFINNAKIIATDIEAVNGVIHVIDAVIVP